MGDMYKEAAPYNNVVTKLKGINKNSLTVSNLSEISQKKDGPEISRCS